MVENIWAVHVSSYERERFRYSWTLHGSQSGPCMGPSLNPAWDLTWTLHGSSLGPCMDPNLDPAVVLTWTLHGS